MVIIAAPLFAGFTYFGNVKVAIISGLTFGVLFGLTMGVALYIGRNRALSKLDDELGAETSVDDRKELFTWFFSGQFPDSAKLKPVLHAFVKNVEQRFISLPEKQRKSQATAGAFQGIAFCFFLLSLLLGNRHLNTYLLTVLSGCNTLFCISMSTKTPNPIKRFFTRKTHENVARMREQLTANH